jgi:predicted DNA-binding protein
MANNKTVHVGVRFSEEERERLDTAAEALDVPAAQIVREAVREKVDRLFETHPKLQPQVAEV